MGGCTMALQCTQGGVLKRITMFLSASSSSYARGPATYRALCSKTPIVNYKFDKSDSEAKTIFTFRLTASPFLASWIVSVL